MKLIAILSSELKEGGGFNQSINAILQVQRLSKSFFDFEVITTKKSNLFFLNQKKIISKYIKLSVIDRLILFFIHSNIFKIFLSKFRIIAPFEKKLLNFNCDLVYFVSPDRICFSFQKLNYIFSIWDLAHRDNPEFPEVRYFNEFSNRDYLYKFSLSKAYAIVVDSDLLAKKASFSYGVDIDRFIVMPFSPSPFIKKVKNNSTAIFLKYDIKDNYLLYPAQFWPHKNHIRIIQALNLIKTKNMRNVPSVIFIGSDKGNLNYIKNAIFESKLEKYVKILGFVPPDELGYFYQNSMGVIMPTYFGPTNLPPLEAWLYGRPLIYSSHLSLQSKNAALYSDPDSATDLAKAIIKISDKKIKALLVKEGFKIIKSINSDRYLSEKLLLDKICRFKSRSECWE